ncbi:MAG TPA: molybdopterin cofactor-binding domain-containing protein [Vicinamibacterales bacterium]|nr:molybdopterin cofactor-binding domain-containing protein [Vicinamibacterales bacterium]
MIPELERYELLEGARYRFDLDRRDFLRGTGVGLFVLLVAPGAAAQESGRGRGGREQLPDDVNAWLHIDGDGAVTVFTGKTEVGQNIRTSLTQAVAEELHVPTSTITLIMADTARTPFDAGTFGSRTTPIMNAQLRKVAAAARGVLVKRAADEWKVSPETLTVADGKIARSGTPGGSLSIGEIAARAPLIATVTDDVATAPAIEWHVAGSRLRKIGGADFVTGRHEYTSDLKRPGLRYGRIVRAPRIGATIAGVDTAAAEALPGVTVVREGDFLGIVADSTPAAAKAASLIKAEWTGGSSASVRTLFDDLKKSAQSPSDNGGYSSGDVDGALSSATRTFQGTYTIAYIAHCPLEPRAALAEWKGDELTVWTGSQRPFGVQGELADAFHVPRERVRVIVPDTGSAYGGKHTGEAAIEAARLARAARVPVKLVWSREEEMSWAYFRPAGVIDIRSAVGTDRRLTAWEYHNYNSGPSGIRTPYAVAHQRIAFHPADSPLRQGSYRGLAATANHFARESHMDEVAAALEIDPLTFRLTHLQDDRIRAVLQAAADRFGWTSRRRGQGRGFGLACGTEKGGYVATCAEVAIEGSAVRVRRAVVAFECGAIVNPDGLKNQVEGAVAQGIGGALFEAVSFDAGHVDTAHFADYRLPRFSDMPEIETVLVNRSDLPSAGAGETPIVGIAPAIGNAIFDAAGVRIRALPMVPNGLPSGTGSQA